MKGSPATTERIINGRRFLVATLKKIVLFPTSSGVKTIPPQEVEVAVRMRESALNAIFLIRSLTIRFLVVR